MTREEEIERAAEAFDIKIISNPWTLFQKGAEWADAHPKPITYEAIENIAKEVIGDNSQLDKLWEMIENNLRDKFIDKACEWLKEQSCCGYIEDIDINEFIKQFKQAMRGE